MIIHIKGLLFSWFVYQKVVPGILGILTCILVYSIMKQKYLEKIGTNITVRPLCTENIFLVSSQPILLVLRALCLLIFVKLCFDWYFNTSKAERVVVGGAGGRWIFPVVILNLNHFWKTCGHVPQILWIFLTFSSDYFLGEKIKN